MFYLFYASPTGRQLSWSWVLWVHRKWISGRIPSACMRRRSHPFNGRKMTRKLFIRFCSPLFRRKSRSPFGGRGYFWDWVFLRGYFWDWFFRRIFLWLILWRGYFWDGWIVLGGLFLESGSLMDKWRQRPKDDKERTCQQLVISLSLIRSRSVRQIDCMKQKAGREEGRCWF